MKYALAAVFAIGATLTGALLLAQDGPVAIPYDDPDMVARGVDVYAATCAACHGVDLKGEPEWRTRGADGLMPAPPHDETGHTWHHPDALLIELTTRGPAAVIGRDYASAMPGYQDVLSERDILAALAYIKSTWPPEVIARHDQMNAGG